ncbi:MAG: hypothetical protein JXP73_04905 [Deltaproteobacteria bacterium]|nr:hypothetical protein [Deltaproteobacteria bacterium]
MNLLEARVALRPRSTSDVIDLAGPFCVANHRLFLPLALWVSAAGGLLVLACRVGAKWPWSWVWLLVAAYLLLGSGVYTVAAGEVLFREAAQVRVSRVLGRFVRRFPAYLATRLVQLVVLGLCAVAVVPLPIFAARLFFSPEAVLLESAGPLAALARSSRLVLYRGVPGFGLALASLAAPFVFAIAADLLGNTLVDLIFQMGRPFGSLWSDGGSAYAVAGALLSAPFVAGAGFLGYVDLRTRKEGWDIQLRLLALADSEAGKRRIAS